MKVNNSQHAGVWIVVVLVGFLLSPIMRTGDSMEAFVKQEVEQTRGALGDKVTRKVLSFADWIFEETPLGVIAKMGTAARLTQEEKKLGARVAGASGVLLGSLFQSYVQGLVMLTYIVAMRFAIVMAWIAILTPLLFAGVFDGFMQRKIKREEFGALRPATFTFSGLLVIPMLAMPFVYLIVPFSLSPLLAPLWALIVVVPLAVMVSNMQPLFGRY